MTKLITHVLLAALLIVRASSVLETDGKQDGVTSERNEEATEDGKVQVVCQSRITILPTDSAGSITSPGCNCSAVQDMIKAELAKFRDSLPSSVSQSSAVDIIKVAVTLASLPSSIYKEILPKDCSEALADGATTSGLYNIQPLDDGRPVEVYCDMDTDNGGWTVFQRRQNGSVDFYRTFASYRRGFGDRDGEFWLGNDNLHRLTLQDEYELRVDLEDFEGNQAYAVYDQFFIGDAQDLYRLTIGEYTGTAGDSLTERHNNQLFRTKDRDDSLDCAKTFHGAWWYSDCHHSNLNGDYLHGTTASYATGIVWEEWKGYYYSLKGSEMKMRMKN